MLHHAHRCTNYGNAHEFHFCFSDSLFYGYSKLGRGAAHKKLFKLLVPDVEEKRLQAIHPSNRIKLLNNAEKYENAGKRD